MLVVISDLHLADGTAGDHNLKPQVYVDLLDRIAEAHAKVRAVNPHSQVQIVYAGDIFDMRRTHFWFQGEQSPWRHFQPVEGADHAKPPTPSTSGEGYLDRAVQLFTQIMTHENVAPIKGILGDRLADRFGGIEPTRVYLPGDSDRLINMSPGLRARVIDFLGLDLGLPQGWNPDLRFPTQYVEPGHGVLIRHGHEWDVYSFEGDSDRLEPQDYDCVPMNDLISCELFARLTYEASLQQPGGEFSAEAIARFRQKIEQLDNVRPVSSVVQWLTRHFTTSEDKTMLRQCIGRALSNFNTKDYVKWWLSSAGHDKWYNPLDEADRLELLLASLDKLWLGKIGAAMKIYDKFAAYDPYERYVDMAAKEEMALQDGSAVQYVVYGHTHWAQHIPLKFLGEEGGPQRDLHYVNVGSLRPTHQVTRDGRNFYVTESLCFGIFYRQDERSGATGPTFELHNVQRSRL
jgi:UDP-2,3-diacylglucosamine pyrophosphatase LpxH